MRIAVVAKPTFRALPLLREAGVEFFTTMEARDLRDAEIIVISPRFGDLLRGLDAPRLKWIHALGAGVETFPFDELRHRDVIVTNSRGVYADALAEFVLAAMLWFAKDLARLARNQAAHRWDPYTVTRLEGQSVGIVGFGGIGKAIARRVEALGMKVVASSRRSPNDEVFGCDYVVLSTALTPATRGLMNAERIASLNPNTVLINISRGAVLDEDALVDALRARRIRGAALDVYNTEPLPPGHPLWALDNVLISPHTADHTDDSHDRAMRFFLENLRRFEGGQPLQNVVDKAAGY